MQAQSKSKSININDNTSDNSTYLCILNFCNADDIDDDDDKNEIISNIRELVNPFGKCLSIDIIKINKNNNEEDDNNECRVLCKFDNNDAVQNAVKFLNNMILGGTPIQVYASNNVNITSYNNNNNNNTFLNINDDNDIRKSNITTAILKLYDVIDDDNVHDDEEIQEVLCDIQYLCPKHDNIVAIWIEQNETPIKSMITNSTIDNDSNINNLPWGIIEFSSSLSSLTCAMDIIRKLNSKVNDNGGLQLEVYLYDYNAYCNDQFSCNHIIDYFNTQINGSIVCVSLVNFIDIDALDDSDEKDEIISNIKTLLNNAIGDNDAEIFFCNDGIYCNAMLTCPSIEQAIIIMNYFSNSKVSGMLIKTELQLINKTVVNGTVISKFDIDTKKIFNIDDNGIVITIRNFFSFDDIDSLQANIDEVKKLKKDLLELCAINYNDVFVRRVSIAKETNLMMRDDDSKLVGCIGFSSNNDAVECMLAIDGIVIGGKSIKAVISQPNSDINNSLVAKKSNVEQLKGFDDHDQPILKINFDNEDSKQSNISKFVEAKEAPSLEKHAVPKASDIPIATAEIDALVQQFLNAISTFQKRADEKERENEKAGDENIVKKRKRYAMGIKQCTTMAKTGRAVLVVLAPNTETAEVIDDKLETLIQHCRDREIPILYALSKRRLGKAINATIKQSVVAVSQPDGCYDIFKKIIKFCESSEDKK